MSFMTIKTECHLWLVIHSESLLVLGYRAKGGGWCDVLHSYNTCILILILPPLSSLPLSSGELQGLGVYTGMGINRSVVSMDSIPGGGGGGGGALGYWMATHCQTATRSGGGKRQILGAVNYFRGKKKGGGQLLTEYLKRAVTCVCFHSNLWNTRYSLYGKLWKIIWNLWVQPLLDLKKSVMTSDSIAKSKMSGFWLYV